MFAIQLRCDLVPEGTPAADFNLEAYDEAALTAEWDGLAAGRYVLVIEMTIPGGAVQRDLHVVVKS